MKLAVFALLLASAYAKCDENCNGNGLCGPSDRCDCFQGWMGVACSERVCPFGNAWIGDHSAYVECSAKGSCDRKAGLCKCQDGFSGSSCQRMVCPGEGNCNGHGKCRPQNMIEAGYNGWDATQIQGCICDPGYGGNACESRICPRGDDALTIPSGSGEQTQRIKIGSTGNAIAGEFTLSFTSFTNEVYTTWAFTANTVTSVAIKEALMALPHNAVPSCTVTDVGTPDANIREFDVKFDHPSNSGNQNTLTINSGGCTDSGCHIAYAGLTSTNAAVTVTASDSDYENLVCSGRGSCDAESGECVCVEGYRGQACEKQSIFT